MKSYPPRSLKDDKLEKLIWFLPGLASTLLIIFIGVLYIAPFAFIGAALFKMHGWIALLVPALGVAIAVIAGLCIIASYRSKSHRLIKKACKANGYRLKVRHNLLTTAICARKGPDMVIDAGEEVYDYEKAEAEMIGPGFYNMDCMDALPQFPDKFFDLAIVDPPYGIKVARHKGGEVIWGGHGRSEATVYGPAKSRKSRINPTIPSRMTVRPTKDISGNWRE